MPLIPLVGVYQEHKGCQVDLSGEQAGFLALADALDEAPGIFDLEVPSHGNANPWDGFITRVEVRPHGEGFVQVTREGATLAFEGGDAKRWGALVANVRNFLPRRGSGRHQHIDYHEDHYFLTAGSVALILSSPEAES